MTSRPPDRRRSRSQADRPEDRSQRFAHSRPADGRRARDHAREQAERAARRRFRLQLLVVVTVAAAIVAAAVVIAYRNAGTPTQASPKPSAGGTTQAGPSATTKTPATAPPTRTQPRATAAGTAEARILSRAADGKVTFVEFLDFECEACRAAYPAIEQLRKEYDGRVTFEIKYFPIESHFNAMRAARAVEAAAQQGALEAMYQKMYDNQTEWAEQQTPRDDTFRRYATELGLDMAAWEAAYSDPATEQRIRKDMKEGEELGVTGTPTFFVNGTQVTARSVDDLRAAIDTALAA